MAKVCMVELERNGASGETHFTRSTKWGSAQNWMRAVSSSTRPASPLCDSPKVAL